MELLTLFRRDIKKKHGTIICMSVLTMLIIALCSITFSIKKNFITGMLEARENCKGCDYLGFCYEDKDTEELLQKLSTDKNTKEVRKFHLIESISKPAVNNIYYGNGTYFASLSEYMEDIRVFDESGTGFLNEAPKLEKNEIYIPIGLKSFYKCEIGDTLCVNFGAEEYVDENGNKAIKNATESEYKIKGFVQMPETGSGVIGWKILVLNGVEFDELYRISQQGTKVVRDNGASSDPMYNFCYNMYKIYKSDDCTLDSKHYVRYLNENMGFSNIINSGISIDESEEYSGLYVNIFFGVSLGFSIVLLFIVLIVMISNISSDIENDYSELGVMKAIGFSNKTLRIRIGSIYIFAELAGAAFGLILAVVMSKILAFSMISNTGVLSVEYFEWIKSLLLLPVIIAISVIAIMIKCRTLLKISPVKAVRGNKNDVYYDNRGNVRITKKGFNSRLAFRTISSEPVRFIGITVITAILCFAMILAMGTINMMKDENVMVSLGIDYCDIYFNSYNGCILTEEKENEILNHVREYSEISHFYDFKNIDDVCINGDMIYTQAYMHPEEITGILKGRAPLYKNEFICTEKVCSEYDLSIGDEVELSIHGVKSTFVLSGINQSMQDVGFCLKLNIGGIAEMIPDTEIKHLSIDIADSSKNQVIVDRLNELYSDDFGRATVSTDNQEVKNLFGTATLLVRIVIFLFSVIFFFVTIKMLVNKAFLKERRDLGIYKSVGFTSNHLRMLFAIRFTMVSVIGAVAGVVFGILFSGKMMGLILYMTGITYLPLNMGLIEVIAVIAVCFVTIFVSAYLTSSRIKTVEVRELIVE